MKWRWVWGEVKISRDISNTETDSWIFHTFCPKLLCWCRITQLVEWKLQILCKVTLVMRFKTTEINLVFLAKLPLPPTNGLFGSLSFLPDPSWHPSVLMFLMVESFSVFLHVEVFCVSDFNVRKLVAGRWWRRKRKSCAIHQLQLLVLCRLHYDIISQNLPNNTFILNQLLQITKCSTINFVWWWYLTLFDSTSKK